MIYQFLKKNKSILFVQFLILLLFFLFLEFGLRLAFKETKSFSCYKKTFDEKKYFNSENCNFVEKHFEKKNITIYKTDNNGFRIGNSINNIKNEKIYFIGDSFTFGHLSNYEKTYPYNSIQFLNSYLNNNKFSEINLGVNGYQFKENLFMMKEIFKTYPKFKIVYGLTPNDLFDLKENIVTKDSALSLIDLIRKKLSSLNLLSIKFIASLLLKNDNIYHIIHNNRGEKSGFVNNLNSSFWKNKYRIFKEELNLLPQSIKENLIITIIPQQIQIRLLKKNKKEEALSFDKTILEICKELKITCISITDNFATKMQFNTHFTFDGHLKPEANKQYGLMLGEKFINILK